MDRKMRHRRGRSLSEALVLDKSDDGGVVISSIDKALSNQNLNEGDQILGATIKFDQLSKEDVMKVLKLMEPYDDKIQVLTKHHRSRSLGNLDECAKTPETMLQASYNKLYNAKIKKYMRGEGFDAERHFTPGDVSATSALPRSPKVSVKHDLGLPRLGVDFGRLNSKTDTLEDSQSNMTEYFSGSNLNLPPLGVGSSQGSRARLETRSPHLNVPDAHFSGATMDSSLEQGNDPSLSSRIDLPKVDIEGLNQDYKMPKFKVPDLGLSSSSFRSPEIDVDTADLKGPDISLGELSLKKPKRNHISGDPRIQLSSTPPDVDLQMPDIQGGISTSNIKAPKAKARVQKPQAAYKAPKFTMPKFDLPDIEVPELPSGGDLNLGLSKPEFGINSKSLDIHGPQSNFGKLKTPNLNFSSPKITGRDLDLPNMDMSKPKLDLSGGGGKIHLPGTPKSKLEGPNIGLKGYKPNLETPDVDITGPSGKFKMPNINFPDFGLSGSKLESPNLDLGSPDLNLSGPNIGGNINTPELNMANLDPKMPKLDFNSPKLNLDIPKLKTPDLHGPDWNIGAPSGKLKKPKINFSGTLGKAKAPKIDVNAPDFNLPNMDLKPPKLDTPDINFGSPKPKLKFPKLKMPKFTRPSLKGPELNGNFTVPDVDVNSPKFDLKGPKGNLDMNVGSLSGKLKKPNFNLPDLGLSTPKLEGPNLDLKSPDLNLSGANFNTGINTPDLSMPKFDHKTPKLGLNTPDLNLDMPSGKLKTPDLHGPDWDINAPSGKFRMPKMNMSGTLPKGLDLDYNGDLKSPDWNAKVPNLNGEMNAPDLNLPKAPKVDMSIPEINIGSPKTKLKLPKLKVPKIGRPSVHGPDIDGNLGIPDFNLNVPKADLGSLSPKLKKPNLNLPDFNLSAPKFEGPNVDLKAPNLSLSRPNLGGGINVPEVNMPKLDLKTPKLDSALDLDLPSGKFQTPEFQSPDWDVNVPSGKFKMPKFDHSGSLPRGPNMDLNADLKAPDFSLKAPKLKGVDVPSMDLPNMNLKTPKLDMNTPDVNIGSPKTRMRIPKMKMPKANLPDAKGIDMEGPNLDINAPNVNLKRPTSGIEMPDVDFASPSGKFKLPQFKVPDVGFSSPKFDGPDLDVGTPDLSGKFIKGPNPKLNVDIPSGKLKSPELHGPEMDVNAPSGKFKMPKMNLPGTLKGGKLDLNADTNLPELNLKAPKMKSGISAPQLDLPNMDLKAQKMKSGISAPELDLPNMDLKAPKLDAKHSGYNISLPDPKFKMPKGPNVDLEGDFQGPDLGLPSLGLSGAEEKFQMPTLNTPDLKHSRSKVRTPDLNVSRAKLKDAGIPSLTMADVNGPKVDLNVNSPDLDGDVGLSDPSFNVPKPAAHLKNPDLNVDEPFLNFKPSFNNGRSDTIGAKMRTPDLDVDEGIRLQHTERKTPRPKPRSNPPTGGSHSRHIDFTRSDLNIDDFTGKTHVLRARGSKLDLQEPNSHSVLNVDLLDSKKEKVSPGQPHHDSQIKVPNSSDGYYVTVFPKGETPSTLNRKYNTLGGLDFNPGNLDLEVPDQSDSKGSSFFFYNLV